MKDNEYRKAFKEVYEVLKFTDTELLEKVPNSFKRFIEENMDRQYNKKINTDLTLEEQKLSNETKEILALIYRSYWASEEEKAEFYEKDKLEEENNQLKYKNIEDVFNKRKIENDNISVTTALIEIHEEKLILRIWNKIKNIFRWKK